MGVPRSCSECLSLKTNLEKPEFLGKASSKSKLQFRYFVNFDVVLLVFTFYYAILRYRPSLRYASHDFRV